MSDHSIPLKIFNPATGRAIGEMVAEESEGLLRKRRALISGQARWGAAPIETRVELIRNFYHLLGDRLDPLAAQLTQETGKPLRQSVEEIYASRGRTLYFLEHSQRFLAPELIIADGETTESVRYEPLGIVGVITSRDFPYLTAIGAIVPALAAGNAVLYKPSEYATLSGLEIKRLFYQAGIPINVLQTVVGGGEVGELLVDAGLDGYFFSGSLGSGRALLERARSRFVPLQLALSGKNPLYVMDDVEGVERTARLAVQGAFLNNGQSFSSIERIYVHAAIHDSFVAAFAEQVKSLAVGDPVDQATDVGPVGKREHLGFLERLVEDALEKGARLLAGGTAIEGEGFFFQPTVLVDVNHSMRVMREETYGPVVGIERVADDEEALRLMQDSEYGLAAYLFSGDEARAKRILDQLDVGTVYWNSCDRVSPYLPWTGRRNSGLGATLSQAGIRSFVKPKAYHVTRG